MYRTLQHRQVQVLCYVILQEWQKKKVIIIKRIKNTVVIVMMKKGYTLVGYWDTNIGEWHKVVYIW